MCAVVTVSLICGSLTYYSASAAPNLPRSEVRASPSSTVVTAKSGSDRIRLETPTPSIPTGESFHYVAHVTLNRPADSVQVRFRARHPSGRLIFQRTRIFEEIDAGTVKAEFERATDDLGLRPGVFPVELEVVIGRESATRATIVTTGLLVYEGSTQTLAIAPVVRIGGQPLSDASGRFVADPERFTRARDDVHVLCSWVLSDPRARLTMAMPPLLLEEWRTIADGYEFIGPEGVEEFGPETAVAREYAATLRMLQSAVASGRLEIAATGYSDPDLSDLADADLLKDIVPQYERGAAAVMSSIEATVSTGTIPSGGCVPPATAELLGQAGVLYAVVDSSCTRAGDATASPSSYRTPTGLVALVPDSELSAASSSGDASTTVSMAFQRMLNDGSHGPLVLLADLGTGSGDAARFTAALESLLPHAWARIANARGVAARPKRSIRPTKGSGGRGDPADYWEQVRTARHWAGALTYAVGEADPTAEIAERSSLVAQCSAWAGQDGGWALADRGRSFADAARRLGLETLDVVRLSIQPVTLPGSSGNVPVTLTNTGQRELRLRLELKTEGGLKIDGARTKVIELGPKETFLELPVDLGNSLSGRLTVRLTAGDVVLDTASVTLRASYLDRIATVAGIVLLLIMLLVFIIKRVRAAEAQTSAVAAPEAYTEGVGTDLGGGRG